MVTVGGRRSSIGASFEGVATVLGLDLPVRVSFDFFRCSFRAAEVDLDTAFDFNGLFRVEECSTSAGWTTCGARFGCGGSR